MNEKYSVLVLEGDFKEYIENPEMQALRFNGLTLDRASVLMQLALDCGFQVIIRIQKAGDPA